MNRFPVIPFALLEALKYAAIPEGSKLMRVCIGAVRRYEFNNRKDSK